MFDIANVTCPYCCEPVELEVDPETTGTFVEDCEVCCNPWTVRVTRDGEGGFSVDIEKAQD